MVGSDRMDSISIKMRLGKGMLLLVWVGVSSLRREILEV